MDTSEEELSNHGQVALQHFDTQALNSPPRRARRRRSNNSDAANSTGASSDPLGPSSSFHSPTLRRKDSFGYDADNEPTLASARQQRRRASMGTSDPPSSRRSLLTKTDSERRLKETLARVNDYDDDRADRMRDLRERFSSSKRSLSRRRSGSRRSSISSFHSSRSRSSIDSSQGSISLSDPHAINMTDPPSQNLSRNRSSGMISSELSFDALMGGNSRDFSSLNVSSSTIPASNGGVVSGKGDFKKRRDAAKTDQLVESLVWFSFHTPRTVMEDLITHEMEIWRRDNRKGNRNGNQSPHDRPSRPANNNSPTNNTSGRQQQRKNSLDTSASSSGSLSSLSDEETPGQAGIFEGDFTESMIRLQGMMSEGDMFKIPKAVNRESALLFVDMSGFTKLSTMLDVESLSKVINSYFHMIVSEVIAHGGDILKFAGDAFFAEWKMDDHRKSVRGDSANPLADLNASLASIHEMGVGDHYPSHVPKLATCVLAATKCAIAIVEKYSDFHVTSAASNQYGDAMLNVHCGVGVGELVGLHVGDYKEDQEEDGVELRREFLILGEPIEQVTNAADVATDGEVYASPEAMMCLRHFCELDKHDPNEPVCIASRSEEILRFRQSTIALSKALTLPTLQPYESLRMHCKALNNIALQRLHLQMALYVHPVIRGDELALSQAIQAGKISQPTEQLESRHRAEAELRSVYTMFIKAVMTPRITGMQLIDEELYKKLNDIMHVTSRELDRYSGHLRQFIVDDKGVVLIATFGLRGSTFPNMVVNNCLPATFAIHRALQSELKVENRIGATFGKVYCGIVGGILRHEFAVMGAPVNLAARLMASKENKGILVDEAVWQQVGSRYEFKKLPPVMAKGYDNPVQILVPLHQVQGSRKKKSIYTFVGRNVEKNAITSVAFKILEEPYKSQSSMVFLMGESGMGKSALAIAVLEQIKQKGVKDKKIVVAARSTSSETEQRIPLSSYRKVFLALVRDHLEHDGTLHSLDESDKRSVTSSRTSFTGLSIRSLHSTMRRGRSTGSRMPDSQPPTIEDGVVSDRPQLTRGLGVRGQTDPLNSRTEHNDSDSMLDQLGQSLRDISEDLLTPETTGKRILQRGVDGTKKYPPYSFSLNHTTHGIGPVEKTVVHETLTQSLHRINKTDSRRTALTRNVVSTRSPMRVQSLRIQQPKPASSMKSERLQAKGAADDSSTTSIDASLHRQATSIPYFEKLCWVCEQLDFPYEYADIVGSQFLGLESASPVTHVDGHVPTMDELVEFLALAFICIADFSDLTAIVLDDFQWVDAFSWKIFRVLCKRGKKMLLICATRSHDKQALRRMSTAIARETQLFNQMIEISLGPLDFSEIRELLANVLGYHRDTISENMCGEVFQKTGGLPVYVVQILENIKRSKATELIDGRVEWTEQGKKDKPTMVVNSNSHGAVMEETFLSRFDSLDVRVRKVLQTCAVLGLSFALSDVIQVHPEMEETDIENALETAVDEMILVEQLEEDEDGVSVPSGSARTVDSDSNLPPTVTPSRSSDGMRTIDDHYYQFSHAMWRKNVLATMLKERKIELHRLIAESMEKDQVLILEQSDISRLLTLFDHWKSCGDFCKSAPLALAVGARLEEWDLSAQSLELYEDALELAYDSVSTEDGGEVGNNEWIQVRARPVVLDLILRLHICIGLCHQRLGDQYESILFFEDAYNIIKTATKVPGMSKSLMMPIISSLCVLKLEQDAKDSKTRREQEKLVHRFVEEATENGNPVHIGRALGLEATRFASVGEYERALDTVTKLESVYDFEKHSADMIAEYGRDFGIECFSESVQWLYLLERHNEAEIRADQVINNFLPTLDPANTDDIMLVVLPVIDVLKLVSRAKDADWLLKKYVINPYHDFSTQSDFWAELFNPLAYLLEVITMEETERFDLKVLEELETWVLQQENTEYSADLERRAHTLMGELCWRLAYFKEEEDPARKALLAKAGELLTPIARYPHPEVFLKHTAQALLEAL